MADFLLSLGGLEQGVIFSDDAGSHQAMRLVEVADRDDHDTQTPVAAGNILQVTGLNGQLIPVTLSGAGGVTGTGTSGTIVLWSGASTIADSSNITESGTVVSLSGSLLVANGLSMATVAKTSGYTATAADYTILCDASSAAFTVTLPAATSHTGRIYHIKKTDSSGNGVTVDGNGSETIDGATTQVISTQYDSLMIQCDGTTWHIL